MRALWSEQSFLARLFLLGGPLFLGGAVAGSVLGAPNPVLVGLLAAAGGGTFLLLTGSGLAEPAPTSEWGRMEPPADSEGTVVVRVFRGSPAATSADAARYLALVAPMGWREASRTYTPGSYGAGAFVAALLLAFVLVGILIFIYMLLVKPAGTLVVTYSRA